MNDRYTECSDSEDEGDRKQHPNFTESNKRPHSSDEAGGNDNKSTCSHFQDNRGQWGVGSESVAPPPPPETEENKAENCQQDKENGGRERGEGGREGGREAGSCSVLENGGQVVVYESHSRDRQRAIDVARTGPKKVLRCRP